jgi:hypothetical protein
MKSGLMWKATMDQDCHEGFGNAEKGKLTNAGCMRIRTKQELEGRFDR